MSEAARSRREDARYEPQFGTSAGANGAASDPLAELARLVGQDDPFRNVFRPRRDPEAVDERHAAYSGAVQDHDAPPRVIGPPRRGTRATTAHVRIPPTTRRSPSTDHRPTTQTYASHDAYRPIEAADERYYAADLAAHHDEAGIADQHAAPEAAHDTMAAIPDLWARDDGRVDGYAPEIDPG